MSEERDQEEIDDHTHVYLDCMVEMDAEINKSKKITSGTSNKVEDEAANYLQNKTYKHGKKPNFLKANSLGMLFCSKAHDHFGPAKLNWEGSWAGKRKIQEAKPLMIIK